MYAVFDTEADQIPTVSKQLTPHRIQAFAGIRSEVAVGPIGASPLPNTPGGGND